VFLARGLLLAVLAAAAFTPAPARAAHSDRHAVLSVKEISHRNFKQWSGMLQRQRSHQSGWISSCPATAPNRCGSQAWEQLLGSLRSSAPRRQIELVNGYVNRYRYVADSINWNEPDHWATPAEFFNNGGDCEDYAIAKYFLLRALGFAPRQLRVVVLRDRIRRAAHAVLAVTLEGQTLVLDNLKGGILPWSAVTHYRPIYALNEDSAWVYITKGITRGVDRDTTWPAAAASAGASRARSDGQ
jgi:predicted transglutaminase-like cysteine proteinase